jgi:hypothetical protein
MLAICKRGLKKPLALSISSSCTKLLQYMGILILKISCSVATTSARGKQEEIQKEDSKQRERGGNE